MEYVLQLRHRADRDDLAAAIDRVVWLTRCSGTSTEDVGLDVTTSLYYPDRVQRDLALESVASLGGVDATSIDSADTDWLSHYQQSLEPIMVGSRFLVVPDAALIRPSDRLSLVIPQERAFGTGSHETTSLCLEALESIDMAGKTAMDIGTGSGILAIAAAKLGAERVIAFDNDVEGWGVVEDNLERNDLAKGRVLFFFGTVNALSRVRCDVVTMNIIPEVIVAMLVDVAALIVPGGVVVLSGILIERRADVLVATDVLGLELVAERTRGEWWAGVLRR